MPMAMNRALSIRSRRDRESTSGRHRFSISTFRGIQAPELSRRLSRLIKSENNAIGAYEAAGRERSSIAAQLSDWGESTEDDAISDISDKLGVMLAEIGEQEDLYAQNLEDSRGVLKHIRNMEASVQPSRDQRQKVTDEIAKLKYKDPNSTRITTLEHELVRAEAQNLVAEAQLSNTTRTKLKEAYDIQLAATIERAEKQIILARHARRLLNYIDDSPVVPGDARPGYEHEQEARQVLEDAETDLRAWEPSVEPITSAARGASLSEQGEAASVTNGDSMVNDLPSAAKQMEEPQSAKTEAEPVPY
ncbi:Sphingolipid long chain base-responsive protein LSP1 [Penicillium manginii]|uniref:Sphingolipid long chain base-responsive protein LSP1 n=1 Tax=Penicillium manginii TaxID=203109 RepID=UPI0025498701|nr:Sphingolipid long chain base-responsive protein LSP1 [Penicillium manginii]KAJ5739800.1 Sphingolipid long chain base-responsive protein LSP1 [Penicillium manginii]